MRGAKFNAHFVTGKILLASPTERGVLSLRPIMNRFWFLCLVGFWSFSPRPAPAQSATNSAAVPFQFRTPQNVAYTVVTSRPAPAALAAPAQWLRALPADGHGGPIELGSRVVLQVSAPEDVARLLHGRPLILARTLTPHLVILQAPDAWTAAREAAALAQLPEVITSHPVRRRALQRHEIGRASCRERVCLAV